MNTKLLWRVLRPLCGGMMACLLLLCAQGCTTQEDAMAAATQMAATAQTLRAYYGALDQVVGQTQDAYEAQYVLQGIPVQNLEETRHEIRVREDMATQIGLLASLFQTLTVSSAAGDSSAAVAKLNDSVVALTPMGHNDAEAQAVTKGIQQVVALLQQHEEVRAAKQLAPLCHQLSVFFESESEVYDSLNQAYLLTAKSVTEAMIQRNEVDVSHVFTAAVQPFGLSPAVESKSSNAALQSYLMKEVADSYRTRLADAQAATAALNTALRQMDARITLVAVDRPMRFRREPFSLLTVRAWIRQTWAEGGQG